MTFSIPGVRAVPTPASRNSIRPSGARNRRRADRAIPERLLLEALEQRRVLAAMPTVSFVNDPGNGAALVADPFIGEQSSFTLRFNNASPTDAGFGPYVDLYFPATGADGDDGFEFSSATYQNMNLAATTVVLTDAGVPHPFAKDANGNPLIITPPPGFKAGDKLVVLQLPFGSFTAGQPPVDIAVNYTTSNRADVGTGLPVQAQAGFRYGNDGLDNPVTDPTITGPSASQTFTPALFRVTKENLAPEHETATGPNFTRQFRVRVDVADGQTVTDLELSDTLPDTLQYVLLDAVSGQGSGSVTIVSTPSTASPGGTLARSLNRVVGTTGGVDAEMTFSYFVPITAGGGSPAPVLDPTTGNDRTITNTADASGGWTPLDPRDQTIDNTDPSNPVAVPTAVSGSATNNHDLVAKSLATQKSVTNVSNPGSGPVPGNVLQYTVNFQVSDYFAFKDLVITDLLGDGQTFVAGSATLTVNDGHSPGTISGVAFNATNLTEEVNAVGGADRITFRVSDELALRGFSTDGRLVGGMIPAGGTGGGAPAAGPPTLFGGTTGSITFRAVVNDKYDVDFPSGDPALDPGDRVTNNVTIAGGLLAVADLSSQGTTEADTSNTSVTVPKGSFSKDVYAVNGTVGSYPATTPVTVGDTVTYRLRYTLPTSDVENLVLTDYLPLPIFDVDDPGTGVLAFDVAADGTGNAPAAGHWTYNSGDTFHTVTSLTPTITNDSAANSVTFSYGTYNDQSNTPSVIDILFSVTASAQPFADSLRLANRATLSAQNTNQEAETGDKIAEVTSSTPELRITKGIVATDNTNGVFSPTTTGPVTFNAPGTSGARWTSGTITSTNLATSPVNSNLSRVDNGDLVTYAIVVENRGSGRFGAFDTLIKDSPAAGMAIPAGGLNLRVTDGAGTPVPFTPIGTGLFDPSGGIELTDPSATQGAIGRGIDANGSTVTDGSNIVVITYDMRVLENPVLSQLTNTGAVTNYASKEGGPDFTGSGSLTDPAVITIATENLLDKELVSTEIVDAFINAANEAVIGELVTYRVTITVPEAIMPNAVLVDTLDARMAFVDMVGVTVSPGVTISGSSNAVVASNGRTVTFNLGDISNSDTDNTTAETITFEYRAVVLNTASANAGGRVRNTASLSFDGLDNPKTARAATVTIIEPRVAVTKSAVFDDGQPTGDADDAVTYTITLRNPPGSQASTADAFNVTFEDALPKLPGGSLIVGNGTASPTFLVNDSAGTVTAAAFELVGSDAAGYTLRTLPGSSFDLPVDASRTITITIHGKLPAAVSGLVTPGDVINNTAAALWSSLSGDVSTPRSTYNPNSVERTGAGGINDYRATASDDLRVAGVGIDKSVVATSESATANPDRVVVGEIVRYRLEAVVPEGTSASLVLQDQIPAGLQFLDDGTAFVAFISNGGGMTSSTVTGTGPNVTGSAAVGVTPNFLVPAAAILGGPFSSGTDVSFDFGSVTNADSDADSEFIVVEFNALVTNVASNQADASLTNRVNVLVNSATTGTASTVVRVAEPVIRTFTKQAVENDDVTPAVGPFDAGDSVRYLIDLVAETGNGRSIAYDTLVSDTLPVTESFLPGSLRVFRNNTQINTGFTATVTGQRVDVTVDEIAPGDEIRVFYEVTLTQAVVAGATVINTADLTYTSLPSAGSAGNSTGSVTPGLSGSETGERNGSGGINDYSGQTSTTIAIKKPDIEKSIFEASPVETASNRFDPNRPDFTIGEVVTFRLTATLPEGTTQLLVLSDQLPVGMEFLEDINGNLMALPRVVAVGGNIAGSSLAVGSPGTLNAGGTGVSFDFGTVINAPDGLVDANDQIVVELQTQVQNIPALVAGGTLTNTGVLTHTIDSTAAALQDAVTADIVEPSLETTKEIVAIQRSGSGTPTPTAPTGSVSLNRGDIVTYRVTVQHAANSSGPAFTVRVADTLPAGLTLVPGSLQVVQDVVYASSSFYDATVATENVFGNAIEVAFDYLDVPGNDYANPGDGNVAVIEYQARVGTAAPVGTLTNTANITYDSLYTERRSANFPSTTRDYTTQSLAHVLIDVNSIAGHVYVDANNNGVFDTGERPLAGVTMQLTGTDTTGNVGLVTVVTAADGSYLFGNLNPGIYTISQPTQPAGYADGKDVVGTTQPAPMNFGGTIPGGGNGIGTDEITTIVILPGAATANNYDFGELVVDLSVTKTDGANVTTYVPGVDVTYTITVTNEGAGDVAGAVVTDHLPSGTTFVRATNGAIHDGGSPGTVTFTPTNPLAANGGTASFQITIRPDAARTGNLVNEATVATPPGTTDPTPGNNTSTDTNTATPRVDLAITKTDGQAKYSPGQSLTYTIEVSNAGPSFAYGAVVADTIPAVMTNVNWTAAYTGTNSNGPVSGSGNAINETIDLAVNGTAIFTVTGTVDPSATGDLENIARVFAPPGFTDPTPGNNEATDIDEIEPRVDLAITKTDGSEVSQAGAVTTYTIIVTNNGPGTAVGARVQDPLPANVTGATWTATFSPGSGGVTSGSGPLDTTITLLPGGAATYTFAATVSPTAFGKVVNTATVTEPPFSVETNPSNNTATDTNRIPILVTGIEPDCDPRDPQVTVIDPFTGAVRTTFNAYPNEPRFRGGVRVALGDVDGDGIEEIITTPGPGRVTEVRVFRQDGSELTAYRNQPYGSGYLGGADVATGDVDGDGDDDVVTSMIRNAGDVRVLKAGGGRLAVDSSRSIRAFAAGFKGGATVTTADLTGDGKAEVIVGSGPGMPASVRVYDVVGSPRLVDQFTPIAAGFTGGVSVKSAFWNQDGTPDIIVSGGRGAGSVTEIYDGTVAAAANTLLARDAVFAGLGSRNAATNASGLDLNGDNRVDRMFTTQGSGGTSTGVTATDRAGSTVASLTVQRAPLRLASSAPRVTSGDVIWGPVRPLVTTASGLQYREIVVGTGTMPRTGQTVTVHYVGSRQNGAVFGSSRENGPPISVVLQSPGGVTPGPTGTDAGLILGWIEALEGMRVGGRRTLIIPANLAYGDNPPSNSGIQPGDTLVFDIELLAVTP